MKETGILMTPENYSKIESGQKTQTRRIVDSVDQSIKRIFYLENAQTVPSGPRYTGWAKECGAPFIIPIKCPFGTVGDRLYVKEGLERDGFYVRYRRGDRRRVIMPGGENPNWDWVRPTLSPLHMPKWSARLWLELTEVRVERLHDISMRDCQAEGIKEVGSFHLYGAYPMTTKEIYRAAFRNLWESNKIHKPGSWEQNPWVWVLAFIKQEGA